MTIHDATRQLQFQLYEVYDDREAGNISDLVMEHVTGWKRIDRVIHKTVPLSAPQEASLQQMIEELLRHKPVQYVLREAWFYGMPLYVDENVLIPRPETEELADWLIKDQRGLPASPSNSPTLLDIGTGSGCLALAAAKNLPGWRVIGCDVSPDALTVAQKNAQKLALTVEWQWMDILDDAAAPKTSPIDAIISNPPYIPLSDKAAMAPNVVNYEPHLALFVHNDDPLQFYKSIARFAKKHLRNAGCIYLELHEILAASVPAIFREAGYSALTLRKDLQGRDRMLKVQ